MYVYLTTFELLKTDMKKLVSLLFFAMLSLSSIAQTWDLGAGTHFLYYDSKLYNTAGIPVIESSAITNAYSIGGGVHYPLTVLGDNASVNANGGLLLYGRLAQGYLGAQVPVFVNLRLGSYATNYTQEGFAFGIGVGLSYNAFIIDNGYFSDFPTFIRPVGNLELGYNDWRVRFYGTYGAYTNFLNDFPNDKSTATYRTMFGLSLLYSYPIDAWEK